MFFVSYKSFGFIYLCSKIYFEIVISPLERGKGVCEIINNECTPLACVSHTP